MADSSAANEAKGVKSSVLVKTSEIYRLRWRSWTLNDGMPLWKFSTITKADLSVSDSMGPLNTKTNYPIIFTYAHKYMEKYIGKQIED